MNRGPDGRFLRWRVEPVPVYEEPEEWAEIEEPTFMTRLTVGLNFVVQHVYYSYVKQGWFMFREDARAAVESFERDVLRGVEKFVKYPRAVWWFPGAPNVSYDEVPYRGDMIGREREELEEL